MRTNRRRWILALLVLVVVVGIAVAGRFWWQYRFPYGAAHICNKQIGTALYFYAGDHNGRFPAGEASPEASLSLLYEYARSPALLAGKGASVERARAVLEGGGLLGPDNCNWYYVEGLTTTDSVDLLILWDKIPGLGHNCERLPDGGHEVLFLDGHGEVIPESEWLQFLADQRARMPQNAKFPDLEKKTPNQPSDPTR